MTEGMVIDLGYKVIMLVLYVSTPMLGLGLIAGLAISIFQAVTSIQEMTLTFIPKILAIILALVLFGSWMLTQTLDFSRDILMSLPNFVK
jgi:flagellar biosynthesis protein FliQ